MRAWVVRAVWLLPCLLLVTGCGPAVPKEELGTPEFQVPKVPRADQPYLFPPEAGQAKASAAVAESSEPP